MQVPKLICETSRGPGTESCAVLQVDFRMLYLLVGLLMAAGLYFYAIAEYGIFYLIFSRTNWLDSHGYVFVLVLSTYPDMTEVLYSHAVLLIV